MLDGGARRLVHIDMLEVDVVRTAKREMQHSGANSLVTDAVDENEAARVAVFRVGVETDRLIKFELAHADFVELEFFPSLKPEELLRVDSVRSGFSCEVVSAHRMT